MTKQYMQNRELSWLRFNQRVLEEAQDETVPLGERLKFVTIFTSNLDEFFMIRVGSLYDMVMLGDEAKDNKSGLSAAQQLERIYPRVGTLIAMRDEIYQHINEELGHYGISELSMKDLDSREAKQIKAYFREQFVICGWKRSFRNIWSWCLTNTPSRTRTTCASPEMPTSRPMMRWWMWTTISASA